MTNYDYYHKWMAIAINEAKKGEFTTKPNPRVGCVIVKNNQLIAKGHHKFSGQNHAEINTLAKTNKHQIEGADVFITLEPCSHFGKVPPCCDALIKAKVNQVIIGSIDKNPVVNSIKKMEQAGIKVIQNILTKQAEALNPGFLRRFTEGKPWVRLKTAISIDGKIALKNGESKWITNKLARENVQIYRAKSCALITSIETVLMDNPQMQARVKVDVIQPIKVILDSKLKIDFNKKILYEGKVIIITKQINFMDKLTELKKINPKLEIVYDSNNTKMIDLNFVLTYLAKEKQCNEILIEAGSKLSGSFLKQDLVDELLVYQAPKILGNGKNCFDFELDKLSNSINLKLKTSKKLGNDNLFIYEIIRK